MLKNPHACADRSVYNNDITGLHIYLRSRKHMFLPSSLRSAEGLTGVSALSLLRPSKDEASLSLDIINEDGDLTVR